MARVPTPLVVSAAVISAREARHVLLALQGLSDPPRASSAAAVARVVERLGYVQIDSINVVERAHHLILATRLEGYRASHLTHNLERSRSLFEHWTHDACVIPSRWYPHWKHRFGRYAMNDARKQWWQDRFNGAAEQVLARTLARVKREGPLKARDFDAADHDRGQGWWEWHPEKAALEHLWRVGVLAIARRERFEKVYDLAERVHPEHHTADAPDAESHDDWACRTAIERIGIATERELSAFLNAVDLQRTKRWCAKAVERGELVRVAVESERAGSPVSCVALPEWRKHVRTVDPERMMVLCPFDPVIRDRARAERLFGFEYRFEAFVPAAKRNYGYYVLPLLEGDRLVGRVDPKFDRAAGTLLVRGPWWERGIKADTPRKRRLERALDRLARNIGAERWSLTGTTAHRSAKKRAD
ncbi:MAG: crosslink repair DNA glycosylase YcaQ family protein [Phycisphaerae bacterium]|nr:crosslink repair DNA glycosylase YcaQ family protein [Phycisphaerae bacterium]